MKEEKASSLSLAQPSPQQITSSSVAAGPGAVKDDEIRDNKYSFEDDEELWKGKNWCWERDYEKFPVNNNNNSDNKIAVVIHTSNDAEKKQPTVASTAATTTTTTTTAAASSTSRVTRTIKTEKIDIEDSNNNSAAAAAVNDDDKDDDDDDDDDDEDDDSYYDGWVEGSWAFLNDDDDNYHNSRKQKPNTIVEEDSAVIAIGDHHNLSTKRNPIRPLRPDELTSWANMFNKLVEYKKKYGHTIVPQKNSEYEQLGHWVAKQRVRHRNGELLESRFTLLNSIVFGWEDCKSIRDQENWMKMYQRLVEYKHQYKHTMVPKNYNQDQKLSHWVKWQRHLNNKNELLSNRYDLLQSIHFAWDDISSIKNQEQWMKMYQQLVLYKKQHKCTRVPYRYKNGNNMLLSTWVYTQRYYYNNDKLLEERYNLLDSIDFVWNTKTRDSNNSDDVDDNDNNGDNDVDDDDDEEKPAAIVSTRSLIQKRGYDTDVNVDVHQSREATRSSSISSATAAATKQPPHCRSTSHNSNDENASILTINDDVKQPAVATTTTTKNNNNKISRTIKAEKKDDSYYDDWVTGSWAYLNDDGDNTCGSRKRKRNAVEEEDNAVIAIGDNRNLSTKRKPARQLRSNHLKTWAHMFNELVEYKSNHGHTITTNNASSTFSALMGMYIYTYVYIISSFLF